MSGAAVQVRASDLAQRALADVFEQIERLARVGRERCHGGELYSTAALPYDDAKRVSRFDASQILRLIDSAIDYGRVHLDYLRSAARPESEGDRPRTYVVGDHVLVVDTDSSWPGEIAGFVASDGGLDVVVRNAHGAEQSVDPRDVRVSA